VKGAAVAAVEEEEVVVVATQSVPAVLTDVGLGLWAEEAAAVEAGKLLLLMVLSPPSLQIEMNSEAVEAAAAA
jgi:hypothetical protein